MSLKSILTVARNTCLTLSPAESPLRHHHINTLSSQSSIIKSSQWMITLPAIFLKTPYSWLSSMMGNIPPKHRL